MALVTLPYGVTKKASSTARFRKWLTKGLAKLNQHGYRNITQFKN